MSRTRVLIAEDNDELAALIADWLAPDYDVRVATDGREAVERFDESVDVTLLDRRMPGLSGDEVLDRIRDEHADVRVGMVTAVEPDFDVLAMGFDDYVVKPVLEPDVVGLVRRLESLSDYDDTMAEYYRLASTLATLEEAKSDAELDASDEYAAARERLRAVRERADRTLDLESTDRLF